MEPKKNLKSRVLKFPKFIPNYSKSLSAHFSLEVLLGSPICWKSVKTCQFLENAYDYIKERRDENIAKFIWQMEEDAEPKNCNLWGMKENWEEILAGAHYEILTTMYTVDKDSKKLKETQIFVNNKSCHHLLRQIRNKMSHIDMVPPNKKDASNWYRKSNGTWEFDEQLFADCWIGTIPKLLPFLWLKWQQFKESNTLNEYYPKTTPSYLNERFKKLVDFPRQMHKALKDSMENGMLYSRYSLGKGPNHFILEFRKLSDTHSLQGSCILEIQVTSKLVLSRWYSKENGSFNVIDQRETRVESTSADGSIFEGTIFIGNDISDMFSFAQSPICFPSGKGGNRFIFLTENPVHQKDSDSFLAKISKRMSISSIFDYEKNPVEWDELSPQARAELYKGANFVFKENKVILKDIIPGLQNSLLSHMKGAQLNGLLINNKTGLFDEKRVPQNSPYYLERVFSEKRIACVTTEITRLKECELIEILKDESIVFISDKSGMGKSWALKSLARKICIKFTDKIVVFISVNEFMAHLSNEIKVGKDLEREAIVKSLVNVFGSNEFEKAVVTFILIEQQTLKRDISFQIMLDGLDEIPRENWARAGKVLKIISTEIPSVRVWVTLKDHMIQSFCAEHGFENLGYSLEPFSLEEQISFLEKYWRLCWDNVNASKNGPSSHQLREFALRCIDNPLSNDEAEIVGIPLLCQLLGDMYVGNVLSKEFSLERKTPLTLITLYRNLLDRKFEIFFREKKKIPEFIPSNDPVLTGYRNQVELAITYYAIKFIFSETVASKFQKSLVSFDTNTNKLNESILQHGIVQNINPVSFVHLTFAEFILALFCCKVLNGDYLHISKSDPEFLAFFWNHVLAVTYTKKENRLGCEFKHPTLCYFLDALVLERSKDFNNNNLTLLPDIDNFELQKGIFCTSQILARFPLFFLLSNSGGQKGILTLIVNSPKYLTDLFITALVNRDYKCAKFLSENFTELKPENWHSLQKVSDNQYGILHWLIQGLIDITPADVDKVATEACNFIHYMVWNHPSVVENTDTMGRTPMLLLLKGGANPIPLCTLYPILKRHNIFDILVPNVNVKDNNLNTLMHITQNNLEQAKQETLSTYKKILTHFIEKVGSEPLINSVNRNGKTPLMRALDAFGDMLSPVLETFASAGADFNLKDYEGSTVLHAAIQKNFSLPFIRELIICGADISIPNHRGQCAIHLAVETNNHELFDALVSEFNADLSA